MWRPVKLKRDVSVNDNTAITLYKCLWSICKKLSRSEIFKWKNHLLGWTCHPSWMSAGRTACSCDFFSPCRPCRACTRSPGRRPCCRWRRAEVGWPLGRWLVRTGDQNGRCTHSHWPMRWRHLLWTYIMLGLQNVNNYMTNCTSQLYRRMELKIYKQTVHN